MGTRGGGTTHHQGQWLWCQRTLAIDAEKAIAAANRLTRFVPADIPNAGVVCDFIRLELMDG